MQIDLNEASTGHQFIDALASKAGEYDGISWYIHETVSNISDPFNFKIADKTQLPPSWRNVTRVRPGQGVGGLKKQLCSGLNNPTAAHLL